MKFQHSVTLPLFLLKNQHTEATCLKFETLIFTINKNRPTKVRHFYNSVPPLILSSFAYVFSVASFASKIDFLINFVNLIELAISKKKLFLFSVNMFILRKKKFYNVPNLSIAHCYRNSVLLRLGLTCLDGRIPFNWGQIHT